MVGRFLSDLLFRTLLRAHIALNNRFRTTVGRVGK